MNFDIDRSIEVLSATPGTLVSLIGDLSDAWVINEHDSETGEQPWAPYDVIGHLIHGELTDWIPRARIILEQGDDPTFVPFDRFAQFENSRGKSLRDLLDEFAKERRGSIETLRSWKLSEDELDLEGNHPELGRVSLRQLLSTWVVHDLTHIRQIVTVMAKRYENEVGAWREYLSILK